MIVLNVKKCVLYLLPYVCSLLCIGKSWRQVWCAGAAKRVVSLRQYVNNFVLDCLTHVFIFYFLQGKVGAKRVVSLRLRNGRFSRRLRRICSPTNEHRRLAPVYICRQTNKQWVGEKGLRQSECTRPRIVRHFFPLETRDGGFFTNSSKE